jgi:hypothetical protein
VLYGSELLALRGVQFDTIIRDDDVGSWVSVIYRKFMGASVRSRRREYLIDKKCARKGFARRLPDDKATVIESVCPRQPMQVIGIFQVGGNG